MEYSGLGGEFSCASMDACRELTKRLKGAMRRTLRAHPTPPRLSEEGIEQIVHTLFD